MQTPFVGLDFTYAHERQFTGRTCGEARRRGTACGGWQNICRFFVTSNIV